ncbi:MAG: DUF502 domain-containing protein [Phycisphaerales bacterium]
MSRDTPPAPSRSFRQFFFRGLGILLPTLVTLWIIVTIYNFVDEKIASPINNGVRWTILHTSPWPYVTDAEVDNTITAANNVNKYPTRPAAVYQRRFEKLDDFWNTAKIGEWAVLDLVGLVIAIVLIYMIGRIVGGLISRRVYEQGERVMLRLPFFKQVYPYVKQITDFFVGDKDKKLQFNRVVAVEYPRKGIWSVGLVTGDTMRLLQDRAGRQCMTVFIPSSPTPFTGYVITVPIEDTLDLPISIDDALRFVISGGVIVPDSQLIRHTDPAPTDNPAPMQPSA